MRNGVCKRGHPLEGDNLAASALRRGKRMCRACGQAGSSIKDRDSPEFQKLADWKYMIIANPKQEVAQ